MAYIPDYRTGTVSLTTGTKNLVGSGTAWVAAGVQPGDMFLKNGFIGLVETVNSNTSITLRDNWGGSTLAAGSTYSIKFSPDQSRVQASVVALIDSMSGAQFTALRNLDISAADRLVYTNATYSLGVSPLTAFARTLLDDSDAGTARATLGAGGLAVTNSWSGANNFNGVTTLTGDINANGTLASNAVVWTDFWSGSGRLLQHQYGYFGTNGSFKYGIYNNGYRNSGGGWTSLAANGSNIGVALQLNSTAPAGVEICIENAPAGNIPSLSWNIRDTEIYPATTNTRDLGTSSLRLKTIYLVNNPNVSSDARYKISRQLTPTEVAAGVQMGRESILYQWKDKVAAEGADVARLHAGVEAQTIARIMADNGLDAARYGFWCADPLVRHETYTEAVTYEKDVVELGEDGQPTVVKRSVTEDVELEREVPELDENGEPIIYQSIRYGELASFIAAAQAAHMDSLEARIAALEGV